MLDGQVEVVRELEDPAQQPIAGGGGQVGALLLDATLQVGEVGTGALPAGLGLVGALDGGLQLRLELLEPLELVGRGGPARVERGDALLRACCHPAGAAVRRRELARTRGQAWRPGHR